VSAGEKVTPFSRPDARHPVPTASISVGLQSVSGPTRRHSRLARPQLLDDAWRCIGEAMTMLGKAGETWCEAEVHRVAGEIALKSPKPDVARA
jgi:hypothetical protein